MIRDVENSIRHNLSLHNRFVRVQNEGTGKSSWWMLNPDAKTQAGKSSRRRPTSTTTSDEARNNLGRNGNGVYKKRGRSKKSNSSANSRAANPSTSSGSSTTALNLNNNSGNLPNMVEVYGPESPYAYNALVNGAPRLPEEPHHLRVEGPFGYPAAQEWSPEQHFCHPHLPNAPYFPHGAMRYEGEEAPLSPFGFRNQREVYIQPNLEFMNTSSYDMRKMNNASPANNPGEAHVMHLTHHHHAQATFSPLQTAPEALAGPPSPRSSLPSSTFMASSPRLNYFSGMQSPSRSSGSILERALASSLKSESTPPPRFYSANTFGGEFGNNDDFVKHESEAGVNAPLESLAFLAQSEPNNVYEENNEQQQPLGAPQQEHYHQTPPWVR